jgi:hypothetical protein
MVVGLFLLARGSGEAQICSPQPFGVDPAYGNFAPTTWIEGDLSWVNDAVGAQFLGVWANTDFDIWFVGSAGYENPPIAAHFDGFSVQPFQFPGTGLLYAVWGSASNDVWAVGKAGLIVHWDGTQWVTVPSGTTENLYAVAGTSSNDVFAGGNRVMLHWDGSSWTNSPGFAPDRDRFEATGLAAISSSDALVATTQGCQRWDGTSWNATACGVQGGRGIFAISSNDIWVAGYTWPDGNDFTGYRAHWDGSSWSTTVVRGRSWGSIGGTGPSDIWIDGTLHYDGNTWTEFPCGPHFTSISVSNNGAIMGVNSLGIEYFSGDDGWPFLARTSVHWIGLGGRDPANIWAVGERGTVIRYDGHRWSGEDFRLPNADYVYRAFGSSPSDIWAARNNGGFYHFDGRAWSAVDAPHALFTTGFARAPNDAIAVDLQNRNWQWDGASWSQITLPIFGRDTISEFWGTAPDDVWAVGGNDRTAGSIYHWDGDSWQLVETESRHVSHVGGSARDDVWFTLDEYPIWGTTVLHWDGASFTEVASFSTPASSITSTNPNDAWLMLERELRHYDGANWTVERVITSVWRVVGVREAGVFLSSPQGHIYQGP